MVTMMNLWLFDNRAPSDDEEVEIVITGFTYTPATTTGSATTLPATAPVLELATAALAILNIVVAIRKGLAEDLRRP
jgi:hypothetical protein